MKKFFAMLLIIPWLCNAGKAAGEYLLQHLFKIEQIIFRRGRFREVT